MKRKYLNKLSKLAIVAAVISIASCKEENGMAPEYMPDMYRSPAVEPYVDYGELRGNYSDTTYTNKMTARKPVAGTIPRGFAPYGYDNTIEGYTLAGENLRNPIAYNDKVDAQGKELYGMFCVHCHGKTGQGDGSLVQNDKFPPLPVKFALGLAISEGQMFHSITYGKGLMGAHASQLNQEERWKLVHYIRTIFMKETEVVKEEIAEDVEGKIKENKSLPIMGFSGNFENDLDLLFAMDYKEDVELKLQGVTFSQASAKLKKKNGLKTLTILADKMKKYPAARILIGGHTEKGIKAMNMKLSKKRAEAVKEHLMTLGVAVDRMETIGFGDSQASADSDKGNRRTVIKILK